MLDSLYLCIYVCIYVGLSTDFMAKLQAMVRLIALNEQCKNPKTPEFYTAWFVWKPGSKLVKFKMQT